MFSLIVFFPFKDSYHQFEPHKNCLQYVHLIWLVISWWSVTHMFPCFLTTVLTQLFFPKPLTTFLTCFCRGERRKYAGKKVCLNRKSNSQAPGHESYALTTKPPRWGAYNLDRSNILSFDKVLKGKKL